MKLWDFGENHFSARKNKYLYDNFVENNMNEVGYKNMFNAIKKYLKSMDMKNVLVDTNDNINDDIIEAIR